VLISQPDAGAQWIGETCVKFPKDHLDTTVPTYGTNPTVREHRLFSDHLAP
jgi:hypothetical protein